MYTDTKASSPNVRKCLSKLGICVRLARCLFHYKRILLHVLPYSFGWDVLDGSYCTDPPETRGVFRALFAKNPS